MVERNLWSEVKTFFRKRTGQFIETVELYIQPNFVCENWDTLAEYERLLRKTKYIITLRPGEYYVAKSPSKNLTLRNTRKLSSGGVN